MDSVVVYSTPHLLYWDWRIAANLFFGGIGVGTFLVAVLNSLYYRDKYPQVSKVGAIISPICVLLGLAFLLADLGHPLRLYRTLLGFNVTSPLSWGGVFQGLLILVGIAYAAVWTRPARAAVRRLVGVLGAPVAVIVGAYHGWLLTIVRARPLWNTGPAMVAALMGFATTGLAAVLLVLCLVDKRTGAKSSWMIHDFRRVLLGALILQCFTFFVWWISLLFGSADARAALAAANAAIGPAFWIVGIGLGLIVPAVLQLVEIARWPSGAARVSIPMTIVTAALVLVGSFVFRYAILIGGQLA